MPDKKPSDRPTRNLLIYLVIAVLVAIGLVAYATHGPGSISVPDRPGSNERSMR
jgi:hypothetical protein